MSALFKRGEESAFLQLLHKKLTESKKILITSHKGPDDDSISSVLGVYHFIRARYPQVEIRVCYASGLTMRWEYFSGYDKIEYGVNPSQITDVDMVLMTDACQWSRVSTDESFPEHFQDKIFAIDHHVNAPEEGIVAYVDSVSSSCAELIYEMLYKESALSKEVAEVILLGILGDTGSFTYINPQQTRAFIIAERLVREGGVNIQSMKASYMGYSETVYRILAFLMNRTEIIHDDIWGTYSVSYIEREEALAFTDDDNEVHTAASGIYANTYTKSITGVTWGFVIYPSLIEDRYNVSARSLPIGVSVKNIFQELGVGGGHILASGGKFMGAKSANEVLYLIKTYLASHSPVRP